MLLVATLLYKLFTTPSAKLHLALKFAELRVRDGHANENEKRQFLKMKKRATMMFEVKYWFAYWTP